MMKDSGLRIRVQRDLSGFRFAYYRQEKAPALAPGPVFHFGDSKLLEEMAQRDEIAIVPTGAVEYVVHRTFSGGGRPPGQSPALICINMQEPTDPPSKKRRTERSQFLRGKRS